jgi:peptide subunit release factor RF-3
LASAKSTIDEAYAGDVIGLYDTGNFKIGDTLTEGEDMVFKGIPSFSPEIFKELVNKDPMKSKQLDKGIRQLTEEGVAQLFIQEPGNRKIVGTVGELQFEVIRYRLEHFFLIKKVAKKSRLLSKSLKSSTSSGRPIGTPPSFKNEQRLVFTMMKCYHF